MQNAAALLPQPLPSGLPNSIPGFKITRIDSRFNSLDAELPPIQNLKKLRYNSRDELISLRSSRNGVLENTRRFTYDSPKQQITSVEHIDGVENKTMVFALNYDNQGRLVEAWETTSPKNPQRDHNQRVEYNYTKAQLTSVIHHWNSFNDDVKIHYNKNNQIIHFELQYGAFNVIWTGDTITRIVSTEKNWESDFRYEYSHGRLQRIHSRGITYTLYYNPNNLIHRIVLLDELYDRHTVTRYDYKPGEMVGIQPVPEIEHGLFFDFWGKPIDFFPLLSLDSIFGI